MPQPPKYDSFNFHFNNMYNIECMKLSWNVTDQQRVFGR